MAKKTATRRTRSSASSRSSAPEKRPEYVRGYVWNEAAANAPVEFIETLCRHPDEHGGQPVRIQLIDWQRDQVLRPLFGWRRPDGRLRYRRAGIFVPKKNRKSSLMSQLAQYLITCHAPAQDVFLAANDRLQARTMFRMVKQSVEASPKLSKMLEVVDSRSIIRNRETGREIRCLSSDSWRNEGLNGSVILDEIHSFKTPDLVSALMYATRGTANGIVISISTAGDNRNGIGWQWWQDCELVAKDPKANPTFYGLIYAAAPDDDFSDPMVWKRANPSMGIAFPEDEFASDYQDACTDPRKMSKFLRYSLNVWQEADSRWFRGDDFASCRAEPPEPLEGRPCAVGIDLASNLDMTAAAFVFKAADGTYDVDMRYWVPEGTIAEREQRDRIPYSAWIREGWVTVTEGARLDHQHVARDLLAYGETHQLVGVGADPWQVGLLASLLEKAGVELRGIAQRTAVMNAPAKMLEGLVVEKRIRYVSPVLSWNANNVCLYTDTTGMIKPDKAKSSEKIDGICALINALAIAMGEDEQLAVPAANRWKIHAL
ncbi:MAG: terminase large subunit [Planctomycetia bacterium]|nr:terminase large subunit [Planctomycetia bacterium]